MKITRKNLIVGILKEENSGERRAPITPDDVRWLIDRGLKFEVASNPNRIFKDSEYEKAGAKVVKKIKKADLLAGIKAPLPENVIPGKIYMIFSHTTKGQRDNIHLLKEMIKRGVTLVDYENIRNNRGKRIVFFGRFAGICGIVDSLHFYGKKMKGLGVSTPFLELKPSWKYESLEKLKKDVKKVGEIIADKGFSKKVAPFIIGTMGRGNVSAGVQEILSLLDTTEVHPRDMKSFIRNKSHDNNKIYSIVFYREEKLRHKDNKKFYFEEYIEHPNVFESNMYKYMSQLSMLVNASYWDAYYPRMITKKMVRKLYPQKGFRLQFIADLSCDIEGSIELTYRATTQKKPVYTYDPAKDNYKDGFKARGISVLAIDNLPTELPKDSSENFSKLIREYVYQVAVHGAKDITEHIALPREIRLATVTQNNKLTESHQYLNMHINLP